MQLILAIDSDTRRSEQLAALVHNRLTVDLVQATSAGEALHVLKDRVPDLILTSPLLSPFDDGVLDEYLRDLGSAAAHIQTLRIPVLSTGQRKGSVAKRLFSLGRKNTDPASAASPDGCDPKIFADEIAHYLARSLEERAAASKAMPETAEQHIDHTVTAAEPAAEVEEYWTSSYSAIEEVDEPVLAALEPVHVVAVEPVEYAYVTPEPVTFVGPEPSSLLADPEPIASPEPPVVERHGTVEPVEPIEQTPRTVVAPAETRRAETTAGTSASFEAALAAIRAAWNTPSPRTTSTVPSHAGGVTPRLGSTEVDLTDALDEAPIGDVARPDDDSDTLDDSNLPEWRQTADTPKKRQDTPRTRKAVTSDNAADWAVLDPNTCDFSSLLKRLDEVTDSDDHPRHGYGGQATTFRAANVR